jgi:hypothetical protein
MIADAELHQSLFGAGSNAGAAAIPRPQIGGRPLGVSMVGLLVVGMVLGYEWLISGVAKSVRCGFPYGQIHAGCTEEDRNTPLSQLKYRRIGRPYRLSSSN